MKQVNVCIRIQEKDVELLRQVAANEQRTLSGIIRALIAEALKARGISIP